jgi:hypothetical protein
VSATGFSLTRARSGRNSFQTEARGTFIIVEQRTRIQVTLGPSPVVLIFVLIWLALVLAFLLGGLSGDFVIGATLGFSPVTIPIAMLLVGVAMVAIGRVVARDDARFLLRFLKDELEADELRAPTPPSGGARGDGGL